MCIRSSKITNLLRSALCACRTALVALKRALIGSEEIAPGSLNELANEDAGARLSARSGLAFHTLHASDIPSHLADVATRKVLSKTHFSLYYLKLFFMDTDFLFHGFRKANKPVYIVRARMSPMKDSELYERIIPVLYTLSLKVAKTVVSRLQAEGYSNDDYGILQAPLAAFSNGVSKGA